MKKISAVDAKRIKRNAQALSEEVVRVSFLLHYKRIDTMAAIGMLERQIKKIIGKIGIRKTIHTVDFFNKAMVQVNAPNGFLTVTTEPKKERVTIKLFYKHIFKYLERFNPEYNLAVARTEDRPVKVNIPEKEDGRVRKHIRSTIPSRTTPASGDPDRINSDDSSDDRDNKNG